MTFVNKWNNGIYSLVSDNGATVTLKRQDGTELTIQKSELNFSYRKIEK